MSSSTPYAPVFTREELSLLKLLVIQELEEYKDQSDTNERGNIYSICCLLYTSPSPRDRTRSRMPSSA